VSACTAFSKAVLYLSSYWTTPRARTYAACRVLRGHLTQPSLRPCYHQCSRRTRNARSIQNLVGLALTVFLPDAMPCTGLLVATVLQLVLQLSLAGCEEVAAPSMQASCASIQNSCRTRTCKDNAAIAVLAKDLRFDLGDICCSTARLAVLAFRMQRLLPAPGGPGHSAMRLSLCWLNLQD
jgi:hypothetical protein